MTKTFEITFLCLGAGWSSLTSYKFLGFTRKNTVESKGTSLLVEL